jgi:hypothetical protein
MFYYAGSLLPIEWTNQHGCGANSKVDCEIVIQYACEDTLDPLASFRSDGDDGTPAAGTACGAQAGSTNLDQKTDQAAVRCGGSNEANKIGCQLNRGCIIGTPRDGTPQDAADAATDRIPNNRASAIPSETATRRFGMHESYDYYRGCQTRGRNRGLFTADQNVNGNDATKTRQNPNGNRNGLECPEERDHYPYWHPTPWKDIAVLTNKAPPDGKAGTVDEKARCDFYQANSQNVQAKGECVPLAAAATPGSATAADVLTGQAAIDAMATRGGRWYNNNAEPDAAGATAGTGAATCTACTTAACTECPQCKKNNANQANSNTANPALRDSCYCATMRGEQVAWRESQFNVGCDTTTGDAGKCGIGGDDGIKAPDCVRTGYSRVNQLGNSAPRLVVADNAATAAREPAGTKEAEKNAVPDGVNANRYLWKIPKDFNKACVLRLRYNISTTDYEAWAADGEPTTTASSNQGAGTDSPIKQDPYVTIREGTTATEDDEFLSLAVNTNQYSRTFQDRSYVFEIRDPLTSGDLEPADIAPLLTDSPPTIVNLNVRGKRGNIVQTYPAVEYDFVPNDVAIAKDDWVHFQWTGSDYNPRRGCNNGEGGPPDGNANQNSRADRHNIVEMVAMTDNKPKVGLNLATTTTDIDKSMFSIDQVEKTATTKEGRGYASARRLAFLDQSQILMAQTPPKMCLTENELDNINNKNARENDPLNCAKLNAQATPYFNGGMMKMSKGGNFGYFSSRNNNFSNRDQTGKICVADSVAGISCATKEATGLDPENDAAADALATLIQQQQTQTIATAAQVKVAPRELLVEPNNEIISPAQEKDNDGLGDGEKEGCETMAWEISSQTADSMTITNKQAAGLAAGLFFFGAALSLGGVFLFNKLCPDRCAYAPASTGPGPQKPKVPKKGDWLDKKSTETAI